MVFLSIWDAVTRSPQSGNQGEVTDNRNVFLTGLETGKSKMKTDSVSGGGLFLRS